MNIVLKSHLLWSSIVVLLCVTMYVSSNTFSPSSDLILKYLSRSSSLWLLSSEVGKVDILINIFKLISVVN